MKMLCVLGSRNPMGLTAQAADALLQGASDSGATCEKVFLPEMKVECCRQCDAAGWGLCRTEGRCVIKDDFAGVVEKIRAADAVVFATPVYYGDLSDSMKTFLDRLRRTCRHADGKRGIEGKEAVGICVAGGSGGGAPFCAYMLDRTLHCGFDVLDVIPVRRQNLNLKVQVLKTTGQWLVSHPRTAPAQP